MENMERDLLLHGKRADNGEWIEGGCIISFSDEIYIGQNGDHIQVYSNDSGNLRRVDGIFYKIISDTLGLCTDVPDKGGTLVYENDIVWDEIKEEYGVVEFDDGEFIVNFNGNIDADRFADVISCCYVCGNIFDNPELLEGGGDIG